MAACVEQRQCSRPSEPRCRRIGARVALVSASAAVVLVAARSIRRRTGRPPTREGGPSAAQRALRTGAEACPGCGMRPPDLRKHMKRCCPEHLPERIAGVDQNARRAVSENDWISEEELKDGALKSITSVEDPLLRQVLELRFGLDRDGERRTPAEVADALGGKHKGKPEAALNLIRNAMRSIPLTADDPKDLIVIFEDDDLLAVMKPPFLRTTPVHRFVGKSLTSQLIGYVRHKAGFPFEGPAPGVVAPMVLHRLDQNTSGVLLTAKTKAAAAFMHEKWHGTEVRKEYLAITCAGAPSAAHVNVVGTGCSGGKNGPALRLATVGDAVLVDVPIGRDVASDDPVRRAVNHEDGQSAVTRLEVLDVTDAAMLLSCELVESGRTHQIRVHAAHAGHPLVGDVMYGGPSGDLDPSGLDRVALHAWRLRVPHPKTGKGLLLEAPLPQDLQQCLDTYGLRLPVVSACETLAAAGTPVVSPTSMNVPGSS